MNDADASRAFADNVAGPTEEYIAALATGDKPATSIAYSKIDPYLTGPVEINAFLQTLMLAAAAMLESAHPDVQADYWGYRLIEDDPDPSREWAARYIVAAMSGDEDRCNDLFFSVEQTPEQIKASCKLLAHMATTLVQFAGREFIASGLPLSDSAARKLSGGAS